MQVEIPEDVDYNTPFSNIPFKGGLVCDYGGKPHPAMALGTGTTEGSVRLVMLSIVDENSTPNCLLAREVPGNDMCMPVDLLLTAE